MNKEIYEALKEAKNKVESLQDLVVAKDNHMNVCICKEEVSYNFSNITSNGTTTDLLCLNCGGYIEP